MPLTAAELQEVVRVVLQQQQVELAGERVDLPLPLLRHDIPWRCAGHAKMFHVAKVQT